MTARKQPLTQTLRRGKASAKSERTRLTDRRTDPFFLLRSNIFREQNIALSPGTAEALLAAGADGLTASQRGSGPGRMGRARQAEVTITHELAPRRRSETDAQTADLTS